MSLAEDYEAVTTHMAADPVDTAAAEPHFKNLVAALSSADTNPLLRVKALQLVGQHGAVFEEQCLKDCMSGLVSTLATQDDQTVLLEAVKAVIGLCKKCIELNSTKGEFVVRESTDLMMQLAIDDERPEAVRKAAHNTFPILVVTDFKAVVTKLLHWLSDDREDDVTEYLATERSFALDKLGQLVSKSYESQWTDEVSAQLLKFMTLILPTITGAEYGRLAASISKLPQVKKANGEPFVDAILSPATKFKDGRQLEMLVMMAPHIPKGTTNDTLAKRLFTEVGNITDDASDTNTLIGKGLVFASRLCSDAVAEEAIPKVVDAIAKVTNNFTELAANLTAFEGLLLCFNALGRKAAITFIDTLNREDVNQGMSAISKSVVELTPSVVFAVKKKMLTKSATANDAKLLGTLAAVKVMADFFVEKKLAPITVTPSWERKHHLPRVKQMSAVTGAPLLQSNANRQKQGQQQHHGRGAKPSNSKRRRQ